MTLREKLIFDGVLEEGAPLPPSLVPPPHPEPVLRLDARARAAFSKPHVDFNVDTDHEPRRERAA